MHVHDEANFHYTLMLLTYHVTWSCNTLQSVMLQQMFQEETFHIGLLSSTHSTLHVFYAIQFSANLHVYLGPMAKHICWAEPTLCLWQHSFEGGLSRAVQPDTAIAHGEKVLTIASLSTRMSWSHCYIKTGMQEYSMFPTSFLWHWMSCTTWGTMWS